MAFAAIDFETANGRRSSVCSVGVVIVHRGEIIDRYYSLIRPYPNYYNPINTSIHGLDRECTDEARPWPEVWAEMSEMIEGLPLVAHNAPFDQSCLREAFRAYGMPYPEPDFYCTLAESRRQLRGQLPNFRLDTVAAACGYELTNHHEALADAEACAMIAVALDMFED